jgi:ABC-2 type transport system ATP-binding protein
MSEALTLEGVGKRFGDFVAVDGLTLRVPAGQVVGFLGPNGAGKTTTLRMVMSILLPDTGHITVLGRPAASEVKDRIGYLPEERGLYRKMTVEKTLRYFGQLTGLAGHDLSRRIAAGLERIGLASWAGTKIEGLSKGMQQKVQFLSTVLHEPELVVLDEPFSGLDPINTEALKELMFDLRRRGTTVLFSTHQMESAERLCDRIVLINRGRLLLEGALSEIRARFASRIVTLEGEGDFEPLRTLPGIVSAEIAAGHAQLELGDGLAPDAVLRRAMERIRVTRFEVHRPNLHQIFVKLVGGDHDVSRHGGAVVTAPTEGGA